MAGSNSSEWAPIQAESTHGSWGHGGWEVWDDDYSTFQNIVTSMDPAKVGGAASAYKDVAARVDETLGTIHHHVQNLFDDWQGPGVDKVRETLQALYTAGHHLRTVAAQTGTTLENHAQLQENWQAAMRAMPESNPLAHRPGTEWQQAQSAVTMGNENWTTNGPGAREMMKQLQAQTDIINSTFPKGIIQKMPTIGREPWQVPSDPSNRRDGSRGPVVVPPGYVGPPAPVPATHGGVNPTQLSSIQPPPSSGTVPPPAATPPPVSGPSAPGSPIPGGTSFPGGGDPNYSGLPEDENTPLGSGPDSSPPEGHDPLNTDATGPDTTAQQAANAEQNAAEDSANADRTGLLPPGTGPATGEENEAGQGPWLPEDRNTWTQDTGTPGEEHDPAILPTGTAGHDNDEERERTPWLPEDDHVWTDDSIATDGVIGTHPQPTEDNTIEDDDLILDDLGGLIPLLPDDESITQRQSTNPEDYRRIWGTDEDDDTTPPVIG
jgi:uncharacterized protein YukE